MNTARIAHRRLAAAAALLTIFATGARATDSPTGGTGEQEAAAPSTGELLDRIESLEKQLRQLKTDTRVIEVANEARAKAKPVAGYQDGFFLASPDGKSFKLKLGGYLQADSRWATDESENPTVNSFTTRRARLDIRGTVGEYFDFRLLPDFTGNSPTLLDAWVDTKFAPWAVLKTGRFKSPYSIERLQSATSLLFIERALTDNLMPNRDVGVQLSGDLRQGELAYQLAVLNGAPDAGSADTDVNDAVDLALRVFAQPFRNTTVERLRGFGLGAAGTWGHEQGTPSSPQLPQFRTSSRVTYFRYFTDTPATTAGTTVADGVHWRVSPQAYWYSGPFGSLFDYGVSSQEISRGSVKASTTNTAWQWGGSWVLTGEAASYAGVAPSHNFDFGRGGWGAWQVALRYASLEVDGETFSKGFADSSKQVSGIDSVTVGLNWYLNKSILWAFDYEHSSFERGAKASNRDPENVFLTRAQLAF